MPTMIMRTQIVSQAVEPPIFAASSWIQVATGP